MNWSDLLLNFSGRISRKAFLAGLVPILLLVGGLYVFLNYARAGLEMKWQLLLGGFIALEAIYFLAALAAKRMHDYGRPTMFLALLFSPLLVAAVFLTQQKYIPLQNNEMAVVAYTLLIVTAMTLSGWMTAELIFRRSDEKANAFGQPPS
jgi:uncharacterized membrane protein YhaH (DUF805 family)